MRIKQSVLINKQAIKCYTRRVNGVFAAVYLYFIKNKFYVNIISVDGSNAISRQCYNVSKEVFDIYMLGDDAEKQAKLIAKGGKMFRAYNNKKAKYKFWNMVLERKHKLKLIKEAKNAVQE